MKNVKLSSLFLFISTFLFIFTITISNPTLFAQESDPEEEGGSCWTCETDSCSAVPSGKSACLEDDGNCFELGAICVDD